MFFERVIIATLAVTIFVLSNAYSDKIENLNPYSVKNVQPYKQKEIKEETKVANLSIEKESSKHL